MAPSERRSMVAQQKGGAKRLRKDPKIFWTELSDSLKSSSRTGRSSGGCLREQIDGILEEQNARLRVELPNGLSRWWYTNTGSV